METLGIDIEPLLVQLLVAAVLFGLPVISLIHLARKKLSGTPLAVWVLVICAVPLLGPLAYWIVKPLPEAR